MRDRARRRPAVVGARDRSGGVALRRASQWPGEGDGGPDTGCCRSRSPARFRRHRRYRRRPGAAARTQPPSVESSSAVAILAGAYAATSVADAALAGAVAGADAEHAFAFVVLARRRPFAPAGTRRGRPCETERGMPISARPRGPNDVRRRAGRRPCAPRFRHASAAARNPARSACPISFGSSFAPVIQRRQFGAPQWHSNWRISTSSVDA